jgi:cytochrome c oxidase subunit I+III
MVFPLFATFYYWAPLASRNMLSERLGRWVFWLMFSGFNIAFFPMHISGLLGMPRRVWTYPADIGWDLFNLISTVGAFILAAGVALFVIDLLVRFRPGQGPKNPWGAGTLEWLPNDVYATRSIPHVTSREPLWDQPGLSEDVEAGRYYLPGAPTGGRETIVTSPVEAEPQYVIQMPGPSWTHFVAAVFTAAFFLLLTVKFVTIAVICGVIALGACIAWVWQLDPGPAKGTIDIGGGYRLPTYMTGPSSHSWWAMVVLMLVAASLYIAYVFSYLYMWTVSPQVWAPGGAVGPPALSWPAITAALMLASLASIYAADRLLPRPGERNIWVAVLLFVSAATLVAAVAVEIAGHWNSGLRPTESVYGAMVYMASFLNGQLAFAILVMALFAIARYVTGRLDAERRLSLENTELLIAYTVGQGLFGLLLLHGFPRFVGA